MKEIQEKHEMAILFITHDLGVLAETADEVVTMYMGQIVERGNVISLFENPQHPYTQGLLESMPTINMEQKELSPITGSVPGPFEVVKGCRFQERCPVHIGSICTQEPPDFKVGEDHYVKCWLYQRR
jgi:oligopeptide/dipeptide ABC transporter ATP-binding protein